MPKIPEVKEEVEEKTKTKKTTAPKKEVDVLEEAGKKFDAEMKLYIDERLEEFRRPSPQIIETHNTGIMGPNINNLLLPEPIKRSLYMCLKRVINTCKNGKWDNYMVHAQIIMQHYNISLEDIKNMNKEFNEKIKELDL